ncbi:LacI family DNA-binding transcriptional regulator [Acaricomes phytoseiuli]|uniref:LacI family DNA-binding transcriptional regulator n=1 Tax=Acaricomes phytoseiuli TaxID=291968 RepID=UPI00037BD720|nr:LacI family DNA-binding transcriptional regulator [Acaricomes phytoseiuli]
MTLGANWKAATLKDVAALAGTTAMTASRAFSKPELLSEETLSKVLAAAKQLGYRHNALARALKQGVQSKLIGVVVPQVANQIFAKLAYGIDTALQEHGYRMMLAQSGDNVEWEKIAVNKLFSWRIDGLIIVPSGDGAFLKDLESRGEIPVVSAARPASFGNFDEVTLDDVAGAELAVNDLIQQGHRRIARLGKDDSLTTANRRMAGYRRALTEAGIEFDANLIRADNMSIEDARVSTEALLSLEDPPTAIFAESNLLTIGALRAASEQKSALAVNGFDDLDLSDLLAPSCGLVSYDAVKMGQISCDLMLSRIAQPELLPRRVVMPSTLNRTGKENRNNFYSVALQ